MGWDDKEGISRILGLRMADIHTPLQCINGVLDSDLKVVDEEFCSIREKEFWGSLFRIFATSLFL
jgi:hypothetical protein